MNCSNSLTKGFPLSNEPGLVEERDFVSISYYHNTKATRQYVASQSFQRISYVAMHLIMQIPEASKVTDFINDFEVEIKDSRSPATFALLNARTPRGL